MGRGGAGALADLALISPGPAADTGEPPPPPPPVLPSSQAVFVTVEEPRPCSRVLRPGGRANDCDPSRPVAFQRDPSRGPFRASAPCRRKPTRPCGASEAGAAPPGCGPEPWEAAAAWEEALRRAVAVTATVLLTGAVIVNGAPPPTRTVAADCRPG